MYELKRRAHICPGEDSYNNDHAVFFIIAPNYKQPCYLSRAWINKLTYECIHKIGYHCAVKNNQLLTHTTICMKSHKLHVEKKANTKDKYNSTYMKFKTSTIALHYPLGKANAWG